MEIQSENHEEFITDSEKEKKEKAQNPVQYYVKFSFMITYILLLTTGIITFIEAMRTKVDNVRHILNLETCISMVAGYFYSVFISKIDEYGKQDIPIDWGDITKTRYIDWSITTPLMLLALTVVLGFNIGKMVQLGNIVTIIVMNYAMLYLGYLGEINYLNKFAAMTLGFIPFFIMFGIIFMNYVLPKYRLANYILYFLYFTVWSLYGVAYMFSEEYKNVYMNILDCIAKCFIGLGLWVYYIRVIRM